MYLQYYRNAEKRVMVIFVRDPFLQKKGEIMDTTQKNRENKSFRMIHFYARRIWRDTSNLVKWLLLAVLTGLTVGAVSSIFARALKSVTDFRAQNLQVFLLLPVSGLCIVFLYQKFGKDDGGTSLCVLCFILNYTIFMELCLYMTSLLICTAN